MHLFTIDHFGIDTDRPKIISANRWVVALNQAFLWFIRPARQSKINKSFPREREPLMLKSRILKCKFESECSYLFRLCTCGLLYGELLSFVLGRRRGSCRRVAACSFCHMRTFLAAGGCKWRWVLTWSR